MADPKKNAPAELVNLPEALAELEKMLKRLGILYNQYLAGATKVPPSQLRLQVERILRDLTKETMRNSTLRHKFHSLSATYASMQALWSAKLREKETGQRPGRHKAGDTVMRFSERRVRGFLQEQAAGKAKAGARKAAEAEKNEAAAREPTGIEKLYEKIAAFQRSANQPQTFQSPEQLGKFLAVQKAKIEQQTGVQGVHLRVVVEDGKLKFKAQMPGATPSA